MDKRKKQPKREIEVDFSEVETAGPGVRVPPGWWKMKNGRFIEIKDMALSHLQFAISLRREKGILDEKYRELMADLDRREMEIVQGVVNRMRMDILNRTPTPPMVVSTDQQGNLIARPRDPGRGQYPPRFFSSQNPFMNWDDAIASGFPKIKPEPPQPKPGKKRKITREKK